MKSVRSEWKWNDIRPGPNLCHVSKIYQAWGAGRSIVSAKDKKEVGDSLVLCHIPILIDGFGS